MRSRRRGVSASARRRSGSGAAFAASVWSAAAPKSSNAYIQRVSSSLYYLMQQVGASRFLKVHMEASTGMPGGYAAAHFIKWVDTVVPMILLDDAHASWSYVGAGWTILSGNHRSSTTGEYARFTTPADTVAVSVKIAMATNCGFAKVVIDGDPTRATLCQTAAEAVAAGTLPAASLVSGGGTLNPTDRVLDCYQAAGYTNERHLVDDLAPGVHTVDLVVTGYKRAAASAARITVDGGYYTTTGTNPLTASVVLLEDKRLTRANSAHEFAYRMKIGGVEEWTGSIHGYEQLVSLGLVLDGTPVTMTDGQTLGASSSIVLNRVSTLHHPSFASAATTTATYTFGATGLRVQHSTQWQTTAQPMICYPAMFPMEEGTAPLSARFNRGSATALAADVNLGVVTGAIPTDTSAGESDQMWMWTAGGRYVVAAKMADPATTLQNWTYSPTVKNFLQDRDVLNKAYWTLKEDSAAVMPNVTSGTVWASDTTYRWAVVTDADLVCSRP